MSIRIKGTREIIEIYRIDFEQKLDGSIRPCFVFAYDRHGRFCHLRFEDIEGDEKEIRELIDKFMSEQRGEQYG